MGDPTLNDGHIPSLLGSGLLFCDCVAVLCEGGAFGGCDIDLTVELPPTGQGRPECE